MYHLLDGDAGQDGSFEGNTDSAEIEMLGPASEKGISRMYYLWKKATSSSLGRLFVVLVALLLISGALSVLTNSWIPIVCFLVFMITPALVWIGDWISEGNNHV